MTDIKLNDLDKAAFIEKLQTYFENEFDYELGQFDADFFIDFISKEFGATFYNQGLYDAQAILDSKLELISEAISELEKPV